MSFARSRQVFGQRRLAEPSRFLSEIPGAALLRSGSPAREPFAPLGARRAAAIPAVAAPEGTGGGELRPGVRVRHPLFGVGTVLRREGEGAELKVTVSFAGAGAKKLVARFAGLEPA
jgi:DNA helicase-2/ATP-dependent DNA helicase PcrA